MANEIGLEIVKTIGGIVTLVVTAWIANKVGKVQAKQDIIHKEINGMQEKYVAAEKTISKEEGRQQGRQQMIEEIGNSQK